MVFIEHVLDCIEFLFEQLRQLYVGFGTVHFVCMHGFSGIPVGFTEAGLYEKVGDGFAITVNEVSDGADRVRSFADYVVHRTHALNASGAQGTDAVVGFLVLLSDGLQLFLMAGLLLFRLTDGGCASLGNTGGGSGHCIFFFFF